MFGRAAKRLAFKTWYELDAREKQRFVDAFVDAHQRQYPWSRSNRSLRALSARHDTRHQDSPSLFAVFYSDIRSNRCRRFSDPSFQRLLVEKKTH
ncbi:hypothetical protein HG536_0H00960 [Torulaspora globosa]|uniref:Uncharacterized protein n=1 Tax=Torulaspora globosa TaxID=48254 RepID=A0A7G3ZMI5_9SACH|nr:uncharacterized protein HG536_0H00960 [Torulaspora globosa]QLL34721.1 hypothetical protein HG536_0H00960 [Torulaspora globosa]